MDNNAAIIDRKFTAVKNTMQNILPKIIGNEVVNYTLDNFKMQGFQGDSFEPWQKRKSSSKRDPTNAILIRSGRGRRGFRVVQATADVVIIGNDVPYMKAHNDGSNERVEIKEHLRSKSKGRIQKITGIKSNKPILLSWNVKAHSRQNNLPKRQMIGKSQYLMNRLKQVYAARVVSTFNKA